MEYNEASKKELLASLLTDAFSNGSVDTSKTEAISFQLRTIPEHDKIKFHDFVKDYLNLCFINQIEQENIKIEDFQVNEEGAINDISEAELITEKIETSKSLVSFTDLFEKIKTELKDYFINYKGYFITELINDRAFSYNLVFFFEDNYHVSPLKTRVKNKFVDYECEFIKIDISKKMDLNPDSNYICIFLLMSKMNNKEDLRLLNENIKEFVESFQEFFYHSITGKDQVLLCQNTNRRDDFVDEIDIVLSTYISNGKINFEEEKIIKKLCANFKSPLIFYKILSGGFSGSKVLEIRPKKNNNFDNDKIYIIKYGYLSDGKIKEEKANFSEFIKGSKGFLNYTDASYEKTLHYEGILYNYAISENSKTSYSFNDILNKTDLPYNDLLFKRAILDKLFNENEAFINWREDYNETKSSRTGDLYITFVSRDKIEKSLSYILNDDIKSKEMLDDFDKISNFQMTYNETVCHGDLHTDNFFIDDEQNVYLIDFGFTNRRHSILDYTSLECSLKFKHFPFYLESRELIEIESELLLERTFERTHQFVSTKRTDVVEYLNMISTIRNNSIKDLYNKAETIEYYISLYLMTIRQIRYPNMNQLYACHSAKILGDYIVKSLSL
ncbi:Response regulator receiver protein [Flavobacterium anhuiense]|uniref:Response regulator receiver protein n=1 Tax=Flavobacterium anhuiense TaxID=459526 RepID=A0A444W517_9FLAO|nr:phosphotransferase [Flavobacterium anhuiense]RYJ40944.1 Response regulator receiver protein [Flavobacterium anhuiense]